MNLKGQIYRFWKIASEKKLRKKNYEHYKQDIEFYNNYKDKKSKSQIKKEMSILHKFWGCYPFQYIFYGMYKNSCNLDIEQMKNYIPNHFAYYLFYPKVIKEYGVIARNKELSYRLFEAYGIEQPKVVLQFKGGEFYDHKKNIIAESDVNKIISELTVQKLFFKPVLGFGGKGILIFNKKKSYVDENHNVLTSKYIIDNIPSFSNYILQEGIVQHRELNNIYPTAINTFRVITKLAGQTPKILFSMLRMGQGGLQIDNASISALVCKIDINTGAFSDFANSNFGKLLDRHPDTKFEFKGYIFPFWKEITEFVISAAKKIDTIKFIGWDVAFSESGPQLIEMNTEIGMEYLQTSNGGVRKEFEIEDPKKYWINNNFVLRDY